MKVWVVINELGHYYNGYHGAWFTDIKHASQWYRRADASDAAKRNHGDVRPAYLKDDVLSPYMEDK